jgi:Transposase DDE domain
VVDPIRETPDKTTTEIAYYLLSAALSPERFNEVVRQHWGVENRLHWRLDVVMNEDQDRTRFRNGPHNLAVLRHMALNAIQKEGSIRLVARKIQTRRMGRRLPYQPFGSVLKCDCLDLFSVFPQCLDNVAWRVVPVLCVTYTLTICGSYQCQPLIATCTYTLYFALRCL